MSPAGGGRRNVYIPDDLWRRIEEAAAREGARRGRPLSISEWLREAASQKIAREDRPKKL